MRKESQENRSRCCGYEGTAVAKLGMTRNRKANLDGDGNSDDGDKFDSGNTGDRVRRGRIHFDEARTEGG